jgi:hypothetical protein
VAIRIKGTRFVYFPVPKCGSTSLKTVILRHNEPEIFTDRIATIEEAHNFPGFGSERWPDGFRKWTRRPFIRPFCIIRDPLERFVSAYRNQVVFKGRMASPPDINTFALGISEYSQFSEAIRYHFAPMVEFIGERPWYYDRVFLLRDIGELPNYLGVDLGVQRANDGGPRLTVADLSASAVDALRNFYARDYAAWGRRLRHRP